MKHIILNQQGFLALITAAISALVISLSVLLLPRSYLNQPTPTPTPTSEEPQTANPQTPCILGDPPDPSASILDLPSVENFGPSKTETSKFVLVRSNIPTTDEFDFFKPPDPFLEPDQDDSHLIQVDHDKETPVYEANPQKPGFDEFYPYGGANGKIYQEWEHAYVGFGFSIIDLGLVFYRNQDPKSIKDIPTADPKVTHHIYSVDIYQDIEKNSNPQLAAAVNTLLECAPTRENTTRPYNAKKTTPNVAVPAQEKSPEHNQLQLEWFIFQSSGVWAIHCKPAVYLYPEKKQLVNVQVFPKGELSYTDPPYNPQTGWTVQAYPDGSLFSAADYTPINQGYLYYESKILDSEIKKPETGWVVKPSEMKNLFNKILPQLGLNKKEQSDFMDYWLNKLPDSPYYFVGLVEKNQRDYLEALKVTPSPETSIRFSLFFEMLDEPKVVEEPKIQIPKRNGFTLVDWGGMVKLHPGTPFTCSQ